MDRLPEYGFIRMNPNNRNAGVIFDTSMAMDRGRELPTTYMEYAVLGFFCH